MPRVEIDGLSVRYELAGHGPTLVLLHGFLFDSRAWRPQLEQLSKQFTVIAWDAPGAGRSDDPPESFTIADWADCLAALLDVARVDSAAHVVGLSWGGLLAQELYRRHGARVRSLVLADTYGGWRGSMSAEIADERLVGCVQDSSLPAPEVVGRYLPGMHSAAAPQSVRDEMATIIAGFHPRGFRLMARALAVADTRELLSSVDVPTLLVWGEVDARSPVAVGEAMAELVPRSRLVVIPGAGHVSNLEAPNRFSALVGAFCLEHP